MNRNTSKINENEYDDCWKFFTKTSTETANCKICFKPISCKASATTGLHRHLQLVHAKKRIPKHEQIVQQRAPISLDKFFKVNRPNLNEIVAKLAAKDGMTLRQICKSDFIRNSLKTMGFVLSKQPRDVMKLVSNYYEEIKESIIQNIKKRKSENQKFSLSIDEWSSFKNRRFLNIHVHCSDNQSFNLGLIRILGSCPAEALIEMVDEKLKIFEISFEKDVVATTSDGASVMMKFGRLSLAEQQFCYNHAIHLAVMSVLYHKISEEHELSDTHTNESDSAGSASEDPDETVSDDNDDMFITEELFLLTNNMNIYDTIKKMRKVVKLFRTSPLKKFILQKYIKEAEKKELSLFSDCRTRWNSLFTMIERFLRVISSIEKALKELNLSNLWTSENTMTAKCILNTLRPVKVAIEALSRADANLLTSEGILKFLFNALAGETSDLSQNLLQQLKLQISKRRNKSLISLLKFLQNPQFSQESDEFFSFTSKADIIKLAKTYMKRLFITNDCNDCREVLTEISIGNTDNNNIGADDVTVEENLDLHEILEKSIQDSLRQAQPKMDNFSSFSREINLYELTGNITTNLKFLKSALITIKPTSTQNERNFSISGNILSKKRTRLSDKSVDCLCFLKHHFINN